ncbi:MAG: DUF6029 family protein, partial [candidate division WOR-3 bacterium]
GYLLLVLFLPVLAGAQPPLQIQGSNRAEFWGYRTEWQTHFEDKLDLSLGYGDIRGGIGLLLFEPSKHSPAVRKPLFLFDYSLAYSPEQLEVLVGRYYQEFGRGLVLRTYSDEDFRHYKSLHGLRGRLRLPLGAELVLLGGRLRDVFFQENTYKVTNSSDTTDGLLGAELQYSPVSLLSASGRYVRINRDVDPSAKAFTELFGGDGSVQFGPVSLYGEGCWRLGTRPGIGGREKGFGWFVSGSMALPGFSVLAEYMDYDRIGFPTGVYRYNDPPTPIKSGVALNRGIDERGWGITGGGTLPTGTYAEVNFGRLFVHDDTGAGVIEWETRARHSAGAEWTFEAKFNHMLQKNVEQGTYRRITDRPILLVNYLFGRHSFSLELECGFVCEEPTDTSHGSRWHYHEPLVSFSWGIGEPLLFTLGWQGVDKDSLKRYSNEKSWPMFETVWNITEQNMLRLRIGAEKGGYTCSGGVCRYESPFNGLKLQLISQF